MDHGEDGPQGRLARIAARAYEISQARAGTGERALDDWLQAERELDGTPGEAPHKK